MGNQREAEGGEAMAVASQRSLSSTQIANGRFNNLVAQYAPLMLLAACVRISFCPFLGVTPPDPRYAGGCAPRPPFYLPNGCCFWFGGGMAARGGWWLYFERRRSAASLWVGVIYLACCCLSVRGGCAILESTAG